MPLGAARRQARVGVAGAGRDVVTGQVVEFGRAARREGDVDHPRGARRVDGRRCARDVVTCEAGQGRFVSSLRSIRDLGIRHPLRVHELRHRADRLLRLRGVDARQVDGDAVEVRTRTPDFGLAHIQGIDAPVDDGDRPLLDIGAALTRREVRQLVIDVGAARQVETAMKVQLPPAEVGR